MAPKSAAQQEHKQESLPRQACVDAKMLWLVDMDFICCTDAHELAVLPGKL
jgi:hypothetical protein